jgi:hypothetical protein
VLVELTPSGRELSEALFGSLIDLVERGGANVDMPAVEVRVQCLRYTANLLEQAAVLLSRSGARDEGRVYGRLRT